MHQQSAKRFIFAALIGFSSIDWVHAQSGTRIGGFAKRRPIPGQNEEVPGERPYLALNGYDPVSVRAGAPKPGTDEFTTVFDSQLYRFAAAGDKSAFAAAPLRFAPVLSGWSVVHWLDRRELRGGSPAKIVIHADRVYLFAGDDDQKLFLANPAKYQDADLLLGGVSPVALVDDQQSVAGRKDQEVLFEGWRFRFTSAAEKAKFLADPGKYYPTLAGADPVSFVEGAVQPGDPKFASTYKNRLYLMSSADNLEKFQGGPKPYADLDVADGGICPVTRVDEGRLQLGKYAISTIHLGRRILFANQESRKKFVADPLKYLPESKKHPTVAAP